MKQQTQGDAVADSASAAVLAQLEAQAARVETPCGEGTMVWRIWGNGAPLVLAHGAQGSWTHWVRNIGRLSATRRLIVPDLPGHGDSAMPETPDHEGISRALALGLEMILGPDMLPDSETGAGAGMVTGTGDGGGLPVDLCGFSFGGVALAHLAALHPGIARRLVIVGCGGLDTPMGHPRLGRISGLTGEARRAALKANLLGLMLHHPESADDLAIAMLLPTAKQARLHVPPLVLPDRLVRILPRVSVPVDAIWGELDLPHPDPAVQEAALRAVQPATVFRVIPESGHWAMYERPQAFEAALLEILALPLRPAG